MDKVVNNTLEGDMSCTNGHGAPSSYLLRIISARFASNMLSVLKSSSENPWFIQMNYTWLARTDSMLQPKESSTAVVG